MKQIRRILLSSCLCIIILSLTYKANGYQSINFPRDEGSHGTSHEWWYLTSHFTTESGIHYTCTVSYVKPNSRLVSITDETNKLHYSKWFTGSLTSNTNYLNLVYRDQSGTIDYWNEYELFKYSLSINVNGVFTLDITLIAIKAPLLHGNGIGVVQMGYGGYSYYYSQTRVSLNGVIHNIVYGTTEEVSGIAWIDHQWGDWNDNGHNGWEWFAIQLNDGSDIMVYCFFDPSTKQRMDDALSVSVYLNNGNKYYFEDGDITLVNLGYFQKDTRTIYSSGWTLAIKPLNIELTITPIIKDQMTSYIWEGSSYVTGNYNDTTINTVCSVELTHNYYGTNQNKLDTNIRFTLSPNPTIPSQNILLSGTLIDTRNDPISYVPIKMEYSLDNGRTWHYSLTLNTNVNGQFSITFTSSGIGQYLIRANYDGSINYNPSNHTETLVVEQTNLSPSVEIWTNKDSYSNGEYMYVYLQVINPNTAISVSLTATIRLPNGNTYGYWHIWSGTLPSNYNSGALLWSIFQIPSSSPSGSYKWVIEMKNLNANTLIDSDECIWIIR